jgi:hypothetical protein
LVATTVLELGELVKRFWLLMCVVGTVVPYAVFIPWLLENGLNVPLLIQQASTPIAAFAWLDVVISAILMLVLSARQISRGSMKHWLVVAFTLSVGVSLGLPLYLYFSDGDITELTAQESRTFTSR